MSFPNAFIGNPYFHSALERLGSLHPLLTC